MTAYTHTGKVSKSSCVCSASPQILQAPSGEHHLNINHELHLVVVASAPPTQELSYQWFRDGQALPYSTGNELYIQHVQVGDQGVYNCRVSTKLGGSKLTEDCVVHGEPNCLLHCDTILQWCVYGMCSAGASG